MCSPARARGPRAGGSRGDAARRRPLPVLGAGRCIGSWPRIGRSGSDAINVSIPGTPNPSWWPRRRTRPGPRDITKLLGPTKWTYFHLYVVLDIFSRYAVGWMVADRENSVLAGRLIEETCHKQGVQPQVLTLHSDRGAPMTSKCTAQLLADLGVTRSLSRPQVSDDNPFSEAQFKTLKYHPGFPGRFHDITAATAFCRTFFPGTTPSIAMAGSRCSPRTTCIIIEPGACWTSAGGPFKPPGPVIPNASFEASQNQTPFPKRSGSIHP